MKTTKLAQATGAVWNIVIIPNHYRKDLATYKHLYHEAKKDFPFLTEDDVRCLTVTESIRYKGCAMLHFQVEAGTGIPVGYFKSDTIEEMSGGSLL